MRTCTRNWCKLALVCARCAVCAVAAMKRSADLVTNSLRHAAQAGWPARKLREKVWLPKSASNLSNQYANAHPQERDTSLARRSVPEHTVSFARPMVPMARSRSRSFSRRMSRATKGWSMMSSTCSSDLSTHTLSSLSTGSNQRYFPRCRWRQTLSVSQTGITDAFCRTNSTLLLSLLPVASCLTASAIRANSQKRMPLRPSSRYSQLSTTCTVTKLSTEVGFIIHSDTTWLGQLY